MNKSYKKQNKNKKSPVAAKRLKSDDFFKKVMSQEVAAREFLDAYLPSDFKELVDLAQIKIEPETYITDDLKKRLSDIVYSMKLKNSNEEAYAYVLIEHQSKPDKMMALRMWEYMLLLAKDKAKDRADNKLPIIVPLVFYNGKRKYTAPTSLWELFTDPKLAKELMGDGYKLIDITKASDDELASKEHLGMFEYFMKHIHDRDILRVWQEFFKIFKSNIILLDKERAFIYIKSFVWYSDVKLEAQSKTKLTEIIKENMDDGESAMRTIADTYVEEGYNKGIAEGIEKGIEQTAISMINEGFSPQIVSKITGISVTKIVEFS